MWATATRWALLTSTSEPLGIDGYYYAIQVRSLLERGALHYPDLPLAFVWLLPFAAAMGPVEGVKLGAAVGTAAIVIPLYVLAARTTGRRAAGVVAAALGVSCGQSLLVASEFVKQGLATTLATACLAALAGAIERPSRGRAAATLAWLGLTLATHRLPAVAALLAGSVALAVRARARRRLAWIGGGLGVAALAAWLAPRAVFGARGAALVGDAFAATADLATIRRPDGVHGVLHPEVPLAFAAAVSLAILAVRRGAPGSAMVAGLGALAACAAFPWWDVADPEGLGVRVRLIAFVPFAACTAALFGRVFAGRVAAALAGGLALVIPVLRPPQIDQAGARVPAVYVQSLAAYADRIRPDSVVVTTQRSLAFMVTWRTRAEARRSVPPDVDEARIWWLLPRADLEPALARALETVDSAESSTSARRVRAPLVLIADAPFRRALDMSPHEVRERWRARYGVRNPR